MNQAQSQEHIDLYSLPYYDYDYNYDLLFQLIDDYIEDRKIQQLNLIIIQLSKKTQMKQRCWKQLKNQLCPRERWVKDSEHSKCQCCSKQFLPLVRRRHHCRFCGNLFCSDCSDYFINGNYIGETKEKYVRHCQFCHKKIQKFIRQWTKMPEIYQEKNVQKTNDQQLSQDEQDQKEMEFNLNRMFQQAEKATCEFNEVLGERQSQILLQATDALCEKFNLDKDIWKQKLRDLAQRAANQTKMQVLVSENDIQSAMDIAKRVKVKTIPTDGNKAVQAMVKGIVLEKNIASKSMQTHLSQPKVLIVEGSIDLDSLASFVKFEQLVKNDKAYMKKILQKIIKLNPDIIFVQNNVHVFVLEYLQSKQIVVVNKLKQKEIEMIKQVTGIKKTIKKLWMLQKYKHHNVMGKCDKIYFKNIKEGQMLMFIQSAQMGIRTILLGQENQEQTVNLKKSIQILMRLARQLNLQKYFILIQKQLKDGIGKKECILPISEDFTPSVYSSIDSFLINQEICFSKIDYYPIKLSQSPKIFQQYAYRVGKASYKQICGKIDFQTKKIYSSQDFTLGAYILMAVANFQRPCKKCLNNHKQQYYLQDYVISIETEKKVTSTRSNSQSFIQIKDQQFTLQNIKSHLTKQKQLIVISTHAQCQICGNTVGLQNVKVGKLFLSNSFHHILHTFVISYGSTIQQFHDCLKQDDNMSTTASRKASRRKLSIGGCDHSILTRVYEHNGIQIKISIQPIRIYYVDYIDIDNKQAIDYIRSKENKYIKVLYEYELNQKLKLLDKISNQLGALPFPSGSGSASLSMALSQKTMVFFDSVVKMKDIIQKCRTQLKQTQQKAVKTIEQLDRNKHDWTFLTRKILKVQSILQLVLVMVDQIQRNLRKKKSEDTASQLHENSVIMQNAEMSQQNDDEVTDLSVIMNNNNTVSQTYLDEETKQYLKKKSKKVFPRIHGAYLHFHTASINDPVSLLACCINSTEFGKFSEQYAGKQPVSTSPNDNKFTFRMVISKLLKTDWPLRQETDKLYTDIVGDLPEKVEAVDIIVYYAKEFQYIRKKEGIDNDLYVRGLCTCKSWDSSGGKSNSLFAKAENDLLVVKVINQKQFDEFLKFTSRYINYLTSSKKIGKDTLLAKVFGIYQVVVKGKAYKCVVMQNIFYGLQSICKVYDLKGSQVNRLNLPPQGAKSSTGQDTNFKIDKQGEPYVLTAIQYDRVLSVLQEDSKFLKDNSVIDYSLLVIESKNSLRIGIIDYMRPYQLMQKIETIYKQFKSGRDPTVIPPGSYAERFVAAMRRYFLKIQ